MTQPQNQKQPSKTVALTAISLILNIVVLALVGGGVLTPDQGAQFNEQFNQQLTELAAQTHQDIQALNDTLQTSWNDTIGDPTFYTTQQLYNYVISNVSGYFCLQNGYTGQLITFNPNQTYIESMALGNLTAGGTVFLKEVTHTSTLTIPDLATVVESVNGVQSLYHGSLPGQVTASWGLSPGAPAYTIASYTTPLASIVYYAKAANGTIMPWSSNVFNNVFNNATLYGNVYLSSGNYTVLGYASQCSLQCNQKSVTGAKDAILTLANNQSANMLWIINFSYAQGQILSGFTVNGNKANQPAYSSDSYQDGIWLQGANNSIVQNLAIWNVQTCSLGCWSTTYQATSNVTIQNNFFNGSRLGLGGLLSSTIANNFIHYGDGHAEAIEMMGSTNPVSGNTITNNHIFDTSLNGGPNTIGIGIKTIAFTGTYNKDNIITNNYINNSNNGILVSGNCFSNIITNNQISFSGYGVVFNDGYLNQIKMNQFDHDTVGVLLQEGA